MRSSRRLALERLEDRTVPALFGLPWADPSHLTLSFAPDTATVNGGTSNLFGLLDARMDTAAWQREILRAFQTWAVHANINIGLIADDGREFGATGIVQGDVKVGDLRVGATALAPDVLAVTIPPDLATASSGDVLLNNTQLFSRAGGLGYDLYTALLQEAGHAFGIGNSPDPNSPMYEFYSGVKSGLTAADIGNLQALYGTRTADVFEGSGGNETLASASALTFIADPAGASAASAVIEGDLTTRTDIDFYRVAIPAGTGVFTVSLKTSGLSLLQAQVRVFDAQGRQLAVATATDPLSGDLTLRIDPALAGSTCYVSVNAGTTDVFAIGRYRLAVGVGADSVIAAAPAGLLDPESGKNDTLATATVLTRAKSAVDSRLDYTTQASFGSAADIDYYRVVVPTTTRGTTTLFVSVWSLNPSQAAPQVSVFDARGREVVSRVVYGTTAATKLEINNLIPGATYYLKAVQPLGVSAPGNYQLVADFRAEESAMTTFATGSLNSRMPAAYKTLVVTSRQQFHFDLGVSSYGDSKSSYVQVTIFDANQNVVATFAAFGGSHSWSEVWLGEGTYTVRFSLRSALGEPVRRLSYELKGYVRTDPIGLTPTDTTLAPVGTTSASYSSPTTTTTTTTTYEPYYWMTTDPTLVNALLAVKDPYSSPWWN